MGTYIEPFDFRTIFVNYFLGTQELLAFAFMIFFSYGCAKYQMSNWVFGVLLAICSSIFALWLGEAMYFIILFVVGFLTSKMFAQFVT